MIHEEYDAANIRDIGVRLDDAIDLIGNGVGSFLVTSGDAIDVLLDILGEKLQRVPVFGDGIEMVLDETGDMIAVLLNGTGGFVKNKIDRFGDRVEDFFTQYSQGTNLEVALSLVL